MLLLPKPQYQSKLNNKVFYLRSARNKLKLLWKCKFILKGHNACYKFKLTRCPSTFKTDARGAPEASHFDIWGHWPSGSVWWVGSENVLWKQYFISTVFIIVSMTMNSLNSDLLLFHKFNRIIIYEVTDIPPVFHMGHLTLFKLPTKHK